MHILRYHNINTLSNFYVRLKKKPETGGSLKSDLQSPKIDQKQHFKSTPERITQVVAKKKTDIVNKRKVIITFLSPK
jgi:hypothetical protein